MTKNDFFARTLLHTIKQRNKIHVGVVENFFYTVDVLTAYRTYYLPKIINVAFN